MECAGQFYSPSVLRVFHQGGALSVCTEGALPCLWLSEDVPATVVACCCHGDKRNHRPCWRTQKHTYKRCLPEKPRHH